MGDDNKTTYRRAGMHSLSFSLDKAIKPAFKKRGFAEQKIITAWTDIVGQTLSQYSAPKKLSFPPQSHSNGTLYVEVYDSGLAMELQHMEPMVIEKISTYFGYQAIGRIRIIQKIVHRFFDEPEEVETKPLTPEQQETLVDMLDGIEDEKLRRTILSLGKTRFERNNSDTDN